MNGYNWNATDPPVYNDPTYEPLDAITIYPAVWGVTGNLGEGDPRVLIVYGRMTADTDTYSQLLSGLWDGNFARGLTHVQSISDQPSYGHASLFQGTVNSPALNGWGQRTAVVQLFENNKPVSTTNAAGAIKHWENFYYYYWGTLVTGPSWHADTLMYPSSATTVDHLFVFPETLAECIDNSKAQYQDLRQWIHVTWLDNGSRKQMSFKSDALVPKNQDIPMSACGVYGGTATDTTQDDKLHPEVLKARQHFWTLVGVILGTPPFSLNAYTATSDFKDFSTLIYGTDETNSVASTTTMSNSVVASGGGEVHGGIKGVFKVTASVDWSYKHAWINNNGDTSTQTVSKFDDFGTPHEGLLDAGKWGWAIFNAPTLVLQNWEAYAYDYDPSTGIGTDLDETLTTFQQSGTTYQKANFELEDPGGPNDLYPLLMKGMAKFACSRDLYGWYNFPDGVTSWETDPRWVTKLGLSDTVNPDEKSWPKLGEYLEKKIQPLQFVPGSGGSTKYAESGQHYDTEGHTNDVTFNVGASFSEARRSTGSQRMRRSGTREVLASTLRLRPELEAKSPSASG